MTRAELINHLEHLAEYVKYSEDAPALREVIEMLKCSGNPNGSDTIYRQVAIDAVYKSSGTGTALKALKALPSAQPEIIHCRDCKHYYYADNRIPQEQRYSCDLDGDKWSPDSFCSFAERREE